MGTIRVKFDVTDAEGEHGIYSEEVFAVLIDTENDLLSVLLGDYEEYNIGMENVHSVHTKGVEITYA